MRTKTLVAAGALASLALLNACGDDSMCSGLKTIADSAGDDFNAVKGAPDDVMPGDFKGKVKLPGASDCTIGKVSVLTYECSWPQKDEQSIAVAYTQLVTQAETCLAGVEKTTEPDRTIWRKPRAWKVFISHRKIVPSDPAPGELRVIVMKD